MKGAPEAQDEYCSVKFRFGATIHQIQAPPACFWLTGATSGVAPRPFAYPLGSWRSAFTAHRPSQLFSLPLIGPVSFDSPAPPSSSY